MKEIPERVIQKEIQRLKANIEFENENMARESAIAYVRYLIEQISEIGGTVSWTDSKTYV